MATFDYDADGNLTADQTHTYAPDAENRLTHVVTKRTGDPESGDRNLDFKYDYLRRRKGGGTKAWERYPDASIA